MKFSFLIKTPKHKKFNYQPRFYNEEEEERRERLKKDLGNKTVENDLTSYRERISGSFRSASRSGKSTFNPSVALIRLGILTFLSIMVVAYLHFGYIAMYGALLFIPFYLYLKFKKNG